MRKAIFIIAFFIYAGALSSSAQVVFSESNTVPYIVEGVTINPYVSISVTDSISSEPMPGAAVMVSGRNSDTLKTVTDKSGLVPSIPNRFIKDTISVYVSFLGYKPVLFRHPVSGQYVDIRIKMQEDPQQINSIIITDKAVAMVIRGDTTIYNASAFKTMKGERLRGLLKQLPGVEVKGDDVYAQGRKISRIMVNGTTLFNRDVKSAMDMIMSDEVTRIRLYDQHDPDRLIEQDTLGRKEKVLDVATKNPKILAQEGNLSLVAGAYTDKDPETGTELLGGIMGNFRRFELDKPQITVMAEADHNVNNNLQGSTNRPKEAVTVNAVIARAIPKKLNYNNVLSFSYDASEEETRTEDSYNPTASYTQRSVESERFSGKDKLQARYVGRISTKVKNSSLDFNLSGAYYQDAERKSDYLGSCIDGNTMLTDVSSYDKSGQGFIQVGYTT